jgi:hypothetical protein
MTNGTESPKMNPEQMKWKGEGWDSAIDEIVKNINNQIAGLSKWAADNKGADQVKMTIDVLTNMLGNLKKAKGNPKYQRFGPDEVTSIIEQVSADILSTNRSFMNYFVESFFPRYMSGEILKKSYNTVEAEEGDELLCEKCAAPVVIAVRPEGGLWKPVFIHNQTGSYDHDPVPVSHKRTKDEQP